MEWTIVAYVLADKLLLLLIIMLLYYSQQQTFLKIWQHKGECKFMESHNASSTQKNDKGKDDAVKKHKSKTTEKSKKKTNETQKLRLKSAAKLFKVKE